MWPDNETTKDLIGFKVHADLIRAVVTNPTMLPTTIGIFGDWGGGKTSIMKMLEWDLDPEHWSADTEERKQYEETAVVYANTWLFEGYDDAKSAIISSILLELLEHKRFGAKVRDGAIALLKNVDWMRSIVMGIKHVAISAAAAAITGGAAAIPAAIALSTGLANILDSSKSTTEEDDEDDKEKVDLKELVKKESFKKEAMDVRTFRKRFGKMLSDGGIKTLVVLVDDLDRCTPGRIIDNLEALKLFLSVEQTAFVIGADRRIVEHAIRTRYAERASERVYEEETQRLVKDYLEKLVQVPYTLPRLSATEIETYMTLLFCQMHLTEADFDLCLKDCETNRSKNRYASYGYASVRAALQRDLQTDLSVALSFTAAAAPLIADGLKGNPRQVKRFLNALLLRKELARVAKLESISDEVLIKLMILEYVHPELFGQLFTWQSFQNGHPKEIRDLEAALAGPKGDVNDEEAAKKIDAKWATTAARRWVAMEPLLKDVDLRDYFWVARDRLESTFAGISMVPPIVRTVLDGLVSGSAPKRNSAMETAKGLSEDERASLLSLIEQRIARQPESKIGYDSLRFLAEAGVVGSAELLAQTLVQRPLENVPPNVGMDFMTLYKAKPDLRSCLETAKERLLSSDSRAGKAAQSAKPAKE
jgi:hypothetical protein